MALLLVIVVYGKRCASCRIAGLMINCQSRIRIFRMHTLLLKSLEKLFPVHPFIGCQKWKGQTNDGSKTTLQGFTNERSHNPSLEWLYSKGTSHFVSNHLLADDYESENGLKDFIYHTSFFSALKSDESIGAGTRFGHCFMTAEWIFGSDATTLLTMEHLRLPVVPFFNRGQHLPWLAQIRFCRSPSLSHNDSVFGPESIQMVRREGNLQAPFSYDWDQDKTSSMLEWNVRTQTTRIEVSNHEFGDFHKAIKYRLEIIDSNWLQSILAPVWSGLDPVYTVWIQFLLELPYDGWRCWVQTISRKTARKRHFSNLMLKLLVFVSRNWFDQAFDRLKPFVSFHQGSSFNRIDTCPA